MMKCCFYEVMMRKEVILVGCGDGQFMASIVAVVMRGKGRCNDGDNDLGIVVTVTVLVMVTL